jgi:hypothetical protein
MRSPKIIGNVVRKKSHSRHVFMILTVMIQILGAKSCMERLRVVVSKRIRNLLLKYSKILKIAYQRTMILARLMAHARALTFA